jgi:4-hydroxy-tetrahydrodipicolinate synthase
LSKINYNHRMTTTHQHLAGVYAAAVTPVRADFSIVLEDVPKLLHFLARRGCHGALLFGTTGEGPSFAPAERLALLREALSVRRELRDFRLLAGTGTPSLEETVELTRAAFDLGVDGAVVLPPYYFRKVSDDGLFAWFSQVIRRAVPPGGAVFGYHVPPISGMSLSLDLLARLKDAFPERFAGIKDSSADAEHAKRLGERFGKELIVLNGNDRLFSLALQNSASGCITALANLCSPDLRAVWDAHIRGGGDQDAQRRLDLGRSLLDRFPPAPPLLKALMSRVHHFRPWMVCPPLLPLSAEVEAQVFSEAKAAGFLE